MTETWSEYLRRISNRAPQVEIAKATGVDPATVSRWSRGVGSPSITSVIQAARHYGRSPVEGLIVAGHLSIDETDGLIEVVAGVANLSDEDLLREVARRMKVGSSEDTSNEESSTTGGGSGGVRGGRRTPMKNPLSVVPETVEATESEEDLGLVASDGNRDDQSEVRRLIDEGLRAQGRHPDQK